MTLRWRSGSELRDSEPAASFVLRLESGLFGLIPIEDEMQAVPLAPVASS